jgi:hypothetical protein
MNLGADVLKEVIENAELYPIRGLFNFRNYFDEIDAYYHRTHGCEFGIPTGWRSLNDLYNVSRNLHYKIYKVYVHFVAINLHYNIYIYFKAYWIMCSNNFYS